MKYFSLAAGFVLLSLMVSAQTYQTQTNLVLEKFAADYSNLSITKGPTEIIINDTSYAVAGAISNGSMVVAISWKGQKVPGQNTAIYTFLQYDTTSISITAFGTKLFEDIAAQFNLSGVNNAKKLSPGQVFPNPSAGRFTFVLPDQTGECIIRIFDNSGKCIRQKKDILTAGHININLTDLVAGNYLAKVHTLHKIYIFHLLIIQPVAD